MLQIKCVHATCNIFYGTRYTKNYYFQQGFQEANLKCLSTAWLTQEMGVSYSASSPSEQTTQPINRFFLHARLASKVKQLVFPY